MNELRVVVDQDLCIGCLLCVDICPGVFRIHDGLSTPVHEGGAVPDEHLGCAEESVDVCPVEAITLEEPDARR